MVVVQLGDHLLLQTENETFAGLNMLNTAIEDIFEFDFEDHTSSKITTPDLAQTTQQM